MTETRRGKQSIEAASNDVFPTMREGENCIEVFDDPPEVLVDEQGGAGPTLSVHRAEYPNHYSATRHHHHRARLLHIVSGVVAVSTARGVWLAPPGHGLLIPSGAEHDARMFGNVAIQILDIEHTAAVGLGEQCYVVGLSPLLLSLIEAASTLCDGSSSDARRQAIARLLLHDLQHSPHLLLSLPLPSGRALARRCATFLHQPSPAETIERWSSSMGMSRRTFTRRFRDETGLSFMAWRQRACLFAAITRMAQGYEVGTVASSLGFERQASLTAMFKRCLGTTPTAHRRSWG